MGPGLLRSLLPGNDSLGTAALALSCDEALAELEHGFNWNCF